MSSGSIFVPIDAQRLEEKLKSIAIAYDLIAVTLIGGDILLGGISKHWAWNGRTVSLSFNTDEGRRFRHSCFIDIPIDLIADISVIPLDDASIPKIAPDDPQLQFLKEIFEIDDGVSTPKVVPDDPQSQFLKEILLRRILPVQDYPNPLASIIYNHDTQVASSQGFTVGYYVEMALAKDAIPPEGIYFEDDFLLYADWSFFLQQTAGSVSLSAGIPGLFNISKDVSQSLQTQVLQRLKATLADKIRKKISPKTGEEDVIQGCILAPEPPETTVIEGEECHLCMIVESQDTGELCPVLFKVKAFKYPLEFLGRVNSVLTFYGELLPIPVEVLGEMYNRTLLARAIGYLHMT
jgi:hypothetical protein